MLPVHRHGRLLRAAVKTILGVAAYSLLASAASAAEDEAKSSAQLDEVVVTGFRGSLEAALDEKRVSAAAIDSIKAEDMAKFPDSNLAESLQRIPGVSIARDAGEGRQISVRGLGAQFTRVRINGMEAMSTTGGTDSSGGANRTRGFDFNVFASELFQSITARKTASADVDEGSLGATVDLRTGRPFDHPGFNMVGSAKAAYNDLSEDIDPRLTFLISNTWADDSIGALFSAAYSQHHAYEEGFSTVRWDNGPSAQGFAGTTRIAPIATPQPPPVVNAGPAPVPVEAGYGTTFQPRIPRYGRLTHDQDRLGLTAAFQWQLNDKNLLNLDVLYSDFKAKRDEQFLEAFSFTRNASQNGKPQTIVRAGEIDANGTMVYGLFDAVDIRSENRHDELETQFIEYTLSGTHDVSDRIKITELVGYSDSDFGNPIQTTVTLDRPNSNGYSWDFRNNDRLPGLNYGFDPNDPANWQFSNQVAGQPGSVQSEIRLRPQYVKNTLTNAQVDLTFEATDHFSVKGGLNFKKYSYESRELRRASETTIAPLPAGTSVADVSQIIHGFGRGISIPVGTPTSWLMPSIDAFNSVYNIYCNCGIYAVSELNARGNNTAVYEKDQGAFLQGVFNFDVGIPIRGDIGVRYVKTNEEAQGYLTDPAFTSKTVTVDYDDVLPSLNVVAELTPDLLVRFGAAKVMTRPPLGSLSPGVAVSLVGNLAVTTGSPDLDPIRATTYDLAGEWYFSKGSLLSLAVFYKDIDSFVQNLVENKTLAQGGYTPAEIQTILAGTLLNGSEIFAFTQPVNSPGGPLHGFEVNYQQQFTFLPGAWQNFGLLLNYTYVDSKIDYITNPTTRATVENDLTGLSRHAYNGTLYYEDKSFSVRLSAAYRDRYLTRVPASNAGVPVTNSSNPLLNTPQSSVQDAEGTNETLNIDFSASYTLNEHLSFSVEGLNLTDQFNDQFIDTKSNRVVVYTHTGRQYFVGARYKL
jgi:TonB-dependent receptor